MNSKILDFYRGVGTNAAGCSLNDIWNFSPGEYEMDHDYIQWMFVTNEPSMMNCDAPVLTKDEAKIFQSDPELREYLKYSFLKILRFFGFRLMESGGPPIVEPDDCKDSRKWITFFNHNFLRITRVIKSLRLCGLPEYGQAFFNALDSYRLTNECVVSDNNLKYWRAAAFGPLWPEQA